MGDVLNCISRSLAYPRLILSWCAMWDLNPLQAVLETAAPPGRAYGASFSSTLYIYKADEQKCQ